MFKPSLWRWLVPSGCALMIAVLVSCEHKPVKLRWNLEKGKTYVYRNDVTGNWHIEGWDQGERSGEFGNLLEIQMKIVDIVDDTTFNVRETMNIIREGERREPSIQEYLMSPSGKYYAITEFDPGGINRVFTEKDNYSRRKQTFDQTQPVYPDRLLKPGEMWVQQTKVVLDDRVLTAENQFEVIGWEKVDKYLCLRIDYHGNYIIPHQKREAHLLDQGKVKGTLWFAPDEGLLIQQRDSFYVSTTRTEPDAPQAAYIVESERIYKLVEIH